MKKSLVFILVLVALILSACGAAGKVSYSILEPEDNPQGLAGYTVIQKADGSGTLTKSYKPEDVGAETCEFAGTQDKFTFFFAPTYVWSYNASEQKYCLGIDYDHPDYNK